MATPLPPVASVAKVVVNGTLGDATIANVLHVGYSFPAPLVVADATTIAERVEESWEADMLPNLSHDYTFTSVTLTDLHTATGVQVVAAAGETGGVAVPSEPAQDAVVVTQLTALRGRSFRGRQYVCGIPTGFRADPQHWTGPIAAGIALTFAGINTDLGALAHPCGLSLVSYFGPPTVLAGAIAPGNPKRRHSTLRGVPLQNGIIAHTGQTRIGTQRRRGQ